ncbi:hypothetical protein EVAR_98978_1 [Eumeta japonica]|uniref:Uncharacterized protein n=1 Tax=Eumeta variegata TaxID=151549 RepID=A0A4C1YT80_EUMVA|nr:hypothetical protein EVAR_98978_1 [Eumeta japonica]
MRTLQSRSLTNTSTWDRPSDYTHLTPIMRAHEGLSMTGLTWENYRESCLREHVTLSVSHVVTSVVIALFNSLRPAPGHRGGLRSQAAQPEMTVGQYAPATICINFSTRSSRTSPSPNFVLRITKGQEGSKVSRDAAAEEHDYGAAEAAGRAGGRQGGQISIIGRDDVIRAAGRAGRAGGRPRSHLRIVGTQPPLSALSGALSTIKCILIFRCRCGRTAATICE